MHFKKVNRDPKVKIYIVRVCDYIILEINILIVASIIRYMISTIKIGISNIILSYLISSAIDNLHETQQLTQHTMGEFHKSNCFMHCCP